VCLAGLSETIFLSLYNTIYMLSMCGCVCVYIYKINDNRHY